MPTDEKRKSPTERSTQLPFCPYCMTPVAPGETCSVCHLKQGAYVPASHHLPPGTILAGRYLIGRVLGEGGFGITYIGCDLRLEMKVAVKEYFPADQVSRHADMGTQVIVRTKREESRTFAEGMGRFLREARTLARMEKQPEIVMVRDFFEANNTAYIVMEYVDGTSFRELSEQKGGRIPASELLPVIEPLFSALSSLHNIGLIHRDISPDNIMLERGQVRLLDFGCARESAGGNATMTVALKQGFAPIEQYQRKNQGPWTDVYALAATIYCCLTGTVPPSSLDRLLDDEVVPVRSLGVDLTPGQQKALMKGMEVQPRKRYQSMEEFHQGLYHPVEPWEDPGLSRQEDSGSMGFPVVPAQPEPAEGPTVLEVPVPEPPGEPEPEPPEGLWTQSDDDLPRTRALVSAGPEPGPSPEAEDIRTSGQNAPEERPPEPEAAPEVRETQGTAHAVPKWVPIAAAGGAVLILLILAVCLILFWNPGRGTRADASGDVLPIGGQVVIQPGEEGELTALAQTLVNCTDSADGASLLDRDAGTELDMAWTSGTSVCYVILRTDPEAEVTGYSLVTAQDATGRRQCNPASWTLYGSSENLAPGSSGWVRLDQRSEDGTLPGAGCVRCDFSLAEGVSYAYYMLKITDNHGGSSLQLAEFSLLTEDTSFSYAEPDLGILHSGVDGDLGWRILTDGTLVVYGDGNAKGDPNWQIYAEEITQGYASITGCGDLTGLFSNLTNLEWFTFELLDTREEAEISGDRLFLNCMALEQVTFRDAHLSGITSLNRAFAGCTSLMALDLCGVSLTGVTSAQDMLEGCDTLAALVLEPGFPSVALPMGGGQVWTNLQLDPCSQTESSTGQSEVYAASGSTVTAGGTSGALLWVLDSDGLLTIAGRGDFDGEDRGWCDLAEQVLYAQVYASNCVDLSGMFTGMTALRSCDFGTCAFAPAQDGELRMTDVFSGCTSLEEVRFRRMDTTGVTAYGMIFSDCPSLRTVDLSPLDGSSAWAMDYLFSGCTSLTELDFTGFDCASATLTEGMLDGCTALEQVTVPANFAPITNQSIALPDPGDGFWVSSDGEICTELVRGADHEITYLRCAAAVEQGISGDLLWVIDKNGLLTIVGRGDWSSPDWRRYTDLVTAGRICVSGCTDMTTMCYNMYHLVTFDFLNSSFAGNASGAGMNSTFKGCTSLEQVNFGRLDTSKVVTFESMFEDCISLTELDLNALSGDACQSVYRMFKGCNSLQRLDFSSWAGTQVSYVSYLVTDCSALEELILPAGFGEDPASDQSACDLPNSGADIWLTSDGEEVTRYACGLDHEVTYQRYWEEANQRSAGNLLWDSGTAQDFTL